MIPTKQRVPKHMEKKLSINLTMIKEMRYIVNFDIFNSHHYYQYLKETKQKSVWGSVQF